MLGGQTCIANREEDQECSLGVHRNGCGSSRKFLHSFLFRNGFHLGTISAGCNILSVEFFLIWIFAEGAILYRMRGLCLKMRLHTNAGFHSLIIDHSCCGIFTLWSEPVGIQIDGLVSSLAGSSLYWIFWV